MSEHLPPNTEHALRAYAALLLKWNARINLVAESTEAELWQRHILDSVQLFDHLPAEARIVADLGSGAGFPGLVLALLAQAAGRATQFHLVESVGKKTAFMEEAARMMHLKNVTVHNARIESLPSLGADVITARAFASITNIFPLAVRHAQKEHLFLLLKGCKAESEIEDARKSGWKFTVTAHASSTDPEGKVLVIREAHHD